MSSRIILVLFLGLGIWGCVPRHSYVDRDDRVAAYSGPLYVYADPFWGSQTFTQDEVVTDRVGTTRNKATDHEVRVLRPEERELRQRAYERRPYDDQHRYDRPDW